MDAGDEIEHVGFFIFFKRKHKNQRKKNLTLSVTESHVLMTKRETVLRTDRFTRIRLGARRETKTNDD